MRLGSRAGVTLMELIIAISLLSLLSVGLLMAMRVGLNAMEKSNNRIMANRRASGAQRVLEQQIAGLIVTSADCGSGGGSAPVRLPFFQGQPQSMRFVSSYSLQEAHRGYPRILEYQVIPGEGGQGVRLIVNERLFSGAYSTGALCIGPGGPGMGALFRPIEIGPQSFVLADKLSQCRFSFQRPGQDPDSREWVPVWGEQQFPLAIRVELVPMETQRAEVPLITITAPVRVNKLPGLLYVD
jgi:prepilin-type N-terminal cleavage/methylation domain-containing protein